MKILNYLETLEQEKKNLKVSIEDAEKPKEVVLEDKEKFRTIKIRFLESNPNEIELKWDLSKGENEGWEKVAATEVKDENDKTTGYIITKKIFDDGTWTFSRTAESKDRSAKFEYQEGDPRLLVRDPVEIWKNLSGKEKYDHLKRTLIGVQVTREKDDKSTETLFEGGILNEMHEQIKAEYKQAISNSEINEEKGNKELQSIKSLIEGWITKFNLSKYEGDTSFDLLKKDLSSTLVATKQQTDVTKKAFLGKTKSEYQIGDIKFSLIGAKIFSNNIDKANIRALGVDVALLESGGSSIDLDLDIPTNIANDGRSVVESFDKGKIDGTTPPDSEPEHKSEIEKSKKILNEKRVEISQSLERVKTLSTKISAKKALLVEKETLFDAKKDSLTANIQNKETIEKEMVQLSNEIESLKIELNGNGSNIIGLVKEHEGELNKFKQLSGSADLSMLQRNYKTAITNHQDFISKKIGEYKSSYISPYEKFFREEKGRKFEELNGRVKGYLEEINSKKSDKGLLISRNKLNGVNSEIEKIRSAKPIDAKLLGEKQQEREGLEREIFNGVLFMQDKVVQVYTNIGQKYHIEKQFLKSKISINNDLIKFRTKGKESLIEQKRELDSYIGTLTGDIASYKSLIQSAQSEIESSKKSVIRKNISGEDTTTDAENIERKNADIDFYSKQISTIEPMVKVVSKGDKVDIENSGSLIQEQNKLQQTIIEEENGIKSLQNEISFYDESIKLANNYLLRMISDGKQKLSEYNRELSLGIQNSYSDNLITYRRQLEDYGGKLDKIIKEEDGGIISTEGAKKKNVYRTEVSKLNNVVVPTTITKASGRQKAGIAESTTDQQTYNKEKVGSDGKGGYELEIANNLRNLQSINPELATKAAMEKPQSRIPQELNGLGTFISSIIIPQVTPVKK